MPGRSHFYDTILRKNPTTGMAEPLADISVEILKILEDGSADPVTPIAYTGRKNFIQAEPMLTDEEGMIDFWMDPGDYNIVFTDTVEPTAPRINPKVVGFSSTPGAPNGLLRSQLPEYGYGLAYPGDMKMSGILADHPGWLLCDGRVLQVDLYPILFAAVSYRWGGSGATFSLPDLRDAVPMGPGNMGTGRGDRNVISDPTGLGKMLGVPTVTLTEDYLPAHTHPHNITASIAIAGVGNHNHGGGTGSMNRSNPHSHPPHPAAVGQQILHSDGPGQFGTPYDIEEGTTNRKVRTRMIGGVGETDVNHEHGIGLDGGHGHPGSSSTISGTVNPNTVQGTPTKTLNNIPPATVVNFFIKM
jgi:microcystin-dependent protein